MAAGSADYGVGVDNSFRVDLGGIVDLLSRHMYSSPRVYLRELVQNAVDAIRARQLVDPDHVGLVVVTPADVSADGALHVEDDGIGLRRQDIDDVLATIGSSSKRDPFGFSRDDFIGQFGIGLLSSFMVTSQVELTTRHVDSDEVLRWVGSDTGSYTVETATTTRESGTEVVIHPHGGADDLVNTTQVRALLSMFAGYLPVPIVLRTDAGDVRINPHGFPWEEAEAGSRREAAVKLCESVLGFTPMDVDRAERPQQRHPRLRVRAAGAGPPDHPPGLRQAHAGRRGGRGDPARVGVLRARHRQLRAPAPTASREAMYDDEALAVAREAFGKQLRRWLIPHGGQLRRSGWWSS